VSAPRFALADVISALQTAVISQTQSIDVVSPGGDYDTIIYPQAVLGTRLSNNLADAADIVTQADPEALSEADALAVVGNEIRRLSGQVTAATLTFYTAPGPISTAPISDITVYRGYPIFSLPDPSTGQTVTAYVTTTTTLPAASAASYYSTSRGRFELPVQVVFVSQLPARLRPGSMTRTLQTLPTGFVGVTNLTTIVPGAREESVADMVARWRLALRGTSTTSPEGIEGIVRGFGLTDYYIANQTSALVTRPETGFGAPVDVFVRSSATTTVSETLSYIGPGSYPLGTPPVLSVDSVLVGSTALTPTTHYSLVRDESNISGSVRARDAIQVTAAGETAIAAALGAASGVGATLTVTYNTAQTVRDLTTSLTARAVGVDPLVRQGQEIPLYLSARVRSKATVAGGFATVEPIVRAALVAYVAKLTMGDGRLDLFDLQAEIGKLPSVDNFVITRLTTSVTGVGATDITYVLPQYLTLAAGNINLTPL